MAIDAKEEFAEHHCLPALMANALYEDKYPLSTAIGRPLIAKKLVETAHKYGATAVAHGCTGKGNDQVRIDVGVRALDPSLEIIAPARAADWPSREELIDYVAEHGIPVNLTKKSPYSIDENLWGRSIECGVLEDPWVAPPEDAFQFVKSVRGRAGRAADAWSSASRGHAGRARRRGHGHRRAHREASTPSATRTASAGST